MTKENKQRWSQKVTENSNALDFNAGVFGWKDPKRIAKSLKKSSVVQQASQKNFLSIFHVDL
ncbi:DUF3175 domain-containing protein [Coxiella-like endosymbiont]|uniref:DUF3175 domain-containing protein n=1 Tax=Coxiella-like endosymbiont TaxID=1592897 RepID=UPI00272BFD8C|nr:DUF3175 domain-containing protein [Coxiella-like endosymbiont]